MSNVNVSSQNLSVDDRLPRPGPLGDGSNGGRLGLRAAVSVMVAGTLFLWGAAIALALALV